MDRAVVDVSTPNSRVARVWVSVYAPHACNGCRRTLFEVLGACRKPFNHHSLRWSEASRDPSVARRTNLRRRVVRRASSGPSWSSKRSLRSCRSHWGSVSGGRLSARRFCWVRCSGEVVNAIGSHCGVRRPRDLDRDDVGFGRHLDGGVALEARMSGFGYATVPMRNPYWARRDALAFEDPDGWRVVFCPGDGS